MHTSFTQSLAHRAPPASRTRGRWQPYAALTSSSASSSSSISSSARNSPASYLCTPTTSVASISPQKTPACDVDPCRPPALVAALSKESLSRDGSKAKFALTLVDQSVKTLCDIWRPQDIPAVFNSPKPSLSVTDAIASNLPLHRLSFSPILANSSFSQPQPSVPTTPALVQTGTSDVRCPLVPIRGFVHEVLRRSRTSGGVLQTALCYLEAVRPKLHSLIQQEVSGLGARGEPAPMSTITPATDAELELEAELTKAAAGAVIPCIQPGDDALDTVKITEEEMVQDHWPVPFFLQRQNSHASLLDCMDTSISNANTSSMPSPLLCPRRTFLAALILASKFTQDKCYSNRAWAKLSGLPPREIGRCERALGNALEWRLWVGKSAMPAVPAAPSNPSHKGVSRSRSEPSIPSLIPSSPSFILSEPPTPKPSLKRSSTLPADGFASLSDSSGWLDVCRDTSSTLFISPLSDVPGLSYSPSSTESSLSSGERTIQMSTFLEDNMAPPAGDAAQSWSWPEPDFLGDTASSSPVAKINGKLLTGTGLLSFQGKASSLWQPTTLLSDTRLSDIDSDRIRIFDPSEFFGVLR